MKIQWMLILALLMVGLFAEAFSVDASQDAAQIAEASMIEGKSEADQATLKTMKSVAGRSAGAILLPSAEACYGSFKSAKTMCIGSLNPEMQKTVATVGILTGVVGAVASTSSSCSKFGDVLKIAQLGLTAYNAMCGTGQQGCQAACSTLGGTFKEEIAKLNTALTAAEAEAAIVPPTPASKEAKIQIPLIQKDINLLTTAQGDVINIVAACNRYKLNLAAAATGLTSIVSSSALAGQCQKDTAAVDCVKDPMNATCAKALDCSKAENANNTTCICLKAPNTAGCAGYTGNSGNQVNAVDDGKVKDLDAGNLSIPTPNIGPDAIGSTGSKGGNGVAPTGGGGGGGGFSGGGTDSSKANAKAQGKGLNANILSGYDGGGGGGGGGYRGSGSSPDSGLQAYLPKGSKDPARNPAMQLFGNGQVTGAGSKSNFEKVSERYNDAKSTLIEP
jgi:uncharacterized membrane protein YgcG